MKPFKQALTLAVFALVVFISGTVLANPEQEIASTDVTIEVFGDTIDTDVSPFISSVGRTMVPVRFPAEALGAEVEWSEDTQDVVINGQDFKHEGEVLVGERTVKMTIGEDEYLIDGPNFTHPSTEIMDTAPFIIDGRTMVPLRFISEGLGFEIEWQAKDRIVNVWAEGMPDIGGGDDYDPIDMGHEQLLDEEGSINESEVERLRNSYMHIFPNRDMEFDSISNHRHAVNTDRSIEALEEMYPNCNFAFKTDSDLYYRVSGIYVYRGILQFEYSGEEDTILEAGIFGPTGNLETRDYVSTQDYSGLEKGSYYQIHVDFGFMLNNGDWYLRTKDQLSGADEIDAIGDHVR